MNNACRRNIGRTGETPFGMAFRYAERRGSTATVGAGLASALNAEILSGLALQP
ncbi:MAG: hypothetical protein LBR08_12620 [Bacteroidales bacterium]|nr:hypothetical protein [Bacteroidales bacterium]